MSRYEEKQEARRERLEARADKLRSEGRARVKRGDDALRLIPFGQPILVGHHSEGRDRRYRARATDNIRAGYETIQRADEIERRAASVGSGGISSDDPEAIDKLQEKLVKLEKLQAQMAAANKLVRKFKRDPAAGAAAIDRQLGIHQTAALELFKPDFAGRVGFADYQLSNNSANIRRIKQRIAYLTRTRSQEPKETLHNSGVRMVENAEDNRLQLFFPAKPSAEARTELKSAGFRWAPTEGAWQRQLSVNARWAAESILERLLAQE